MPTIDRMELICPKDWQVFESITLDAMRLMWDSPSLQKNGREGQKQNGVDIYGPDHLGRPTGIQCKKSTVTLNLEIIEKEIEKAEKFDAELNALYLATTCDTDIKLQKSIRKISEERTRTKKFAVGILFWDEIVSGLCKNPQIFKLHYPQIQLLPAELNLDNAITAFQLGFYGCNIKEFIHLVFGEMGYIAQTDPDEMEVFLETLEGLSFRLLSQEEHQKIKALIQELYILIFSNTESPNWANIEVIHERITRRVALTGNFLSSKESQAFMLGKQLGYAYFTNENLPSPESLDILNFKLSVLLNNNSKNKIDSLISNLKESGDTISNPWDNQIYQLIMNELRWNSN